MAYNNGHENRKWLIWKEAGEKILREHGVEETTIEKIRTDDRAYFNSNRRFFKLTNLDVMEQYFAQLDYSEKERKFWMFVKMAGIKEEVYI